MYSPLHEMPQDARVWVYQSERELTPDETKKAQVLVAAFLEKWTSHDLHLKASYEIRYNRFLVLMIDEKQATAGGCSIDKSVHFIQELEKVFNTSLMNRMLFAYKEGDRVKTVQRSTFEELYEKGIITDETLVFNNLVQSKIDLDTKWEVPLKHSWHKGMMEV